MNQYWRKYANMSICVANTTSADPIGHWLDAYGISTEKVMSAVFSSMALAEQYLV